MFNNPYMPYGYNSMPTATNPYGYPMPQPTAPQSQSVPTVTQTNKIYVNGIEDVRNRQMPNNSDYIFLDNDKPLIYRKTLDATGKMDVQVFKIEPCEEKPTPAATVDMSQYVLKSDFEDLRKEIDKLRRNNRYDGAGKAGQSQNS